MRERSERRRHDRGRRRPGARRRRCSTGSAPGDSVEVAIRPENIRLAAPATAQRRRARDDHRTHVFLGNISEYYATLDVGPVLRVQTHPLQRSPSATGRGRDRRHASAACFARAGSEVHDGVDREQRMNKPDAPSRRHPRRGALDQQGATSACSCGTSAPIRPARPGTHPVRARLVDGLAADLRPAGAGPRRLLGDGLFRGARLRHLVRRHGGLRPLRQEPRQQLRRSPTAPTTASPPRRYIREDCAARGRCWSTASRRARCARRCSRSAIPSGSQRLALDAIVWTGEGRPTLAERSKRLPEFRAKNRRPIDRKFVRSIFERDHPGTADDNVIEAFADAILELDDSIPTGTYVDMCANLPVCRSRRRSRCRPSSCAANTTASPASTDLIEVLREAAEPGQAVRGDAGHRARLVPAEELRDRAITSC